MPLVRRTRLLLDQNVTFNQPAADDSLPPHIDKLAFGYRCQLCQQHPAQRSHVEAHVQSRNHQSMLVLLVLQNNQQFALANKNDVTVDIHNGEETFTKHDVYQFQAGKRQALKLDVRIRNHNNQNVRLDFCDFTKRCRTTIYKIINRPTRPVIINGDSDFNVSLEVKVPNVGKFSKSLFFKFSNEKYGEFYVVKQFSAKCTDKITKELAPTTPYQPVPRAKIQYKNSEIIPGLKVPSGTDDTLERVEGRALKPLGISNLFRSAVNHGLKEDVPHVDVNVSNEILKIRETLETPLDFTNYTTKWTTLLKLEKLQADINVQTYNMSSAEMSVCRENRAFLELEVPGLAENRPSLLRGDILFVSIAGEKTDEGQKVKEYEGHVHNVRKETVWLGFSDRLVRDNLDKVRFNVRFVVPEHVYRLQLRAVDLATKDENLSNVLFPKENAARPNLMHPLNARAEYVNYDVSQNQDQARAVRHIVSGTSRPAPYLIYGPPGTGKTVTVVEAILQIVRIHEDAHILACAPSNSAADLLTERLAALIDNPQGQLFRIQARSRNWAEVKDSAKKYSNHKGGDYYYPSRAKIQEYKIVITTLATAGRLVTAKFPEGHFTHLFVDECGQATEPECIIALAGILSYDTLTHPHGGQVVLAGDPKQLGPIIHSPFAEKFDMGVSFLERLMRDNPLYKRTDADPPYDVTVMTELRHNYRSHPAILEIPNNEFYHKDLHYSADRQERELFCDWHELPKPKFPVIFHGILGEELREGSSPSFFNPSEISIVMEYIDKIMTHRPMGLRYDDIGIITPYRKQVVKLKKLLEKTNPQLARIMVGTVEQFQGNERKVILVSTVRSNPNYGEFDTKFKLGFVANPKKFNVAITRAMALLIVVGNPHCLKHDHYWGSFIRYCQANEALVGVDMEDGNEEILNDVVKEMLKMSIDVSQIRPDTPDQTKYYTAPELRDDNIHLITTLEEFRQLGRRVHRPGTVVGIDAEWTPFQGMDQTLALLQLAVQDSVYILDIPALKRALPPAEWTTFFVHLFTSDEVTKVGFQIASDLSMILTTFKSTLGKTDQRDNFHPNNLKNVCDLYVRSLELEKIVDFFLPRDTSGVLIEPGCHDLAGLVRKTKGAPLDKGPQLSDWDARPLTRGQLRYAAVDAYVLLDVFDFVRQRLNVLNVNNVDLFKKLNNKFWNKLYGPEGRQR